MTLRLGPELQSALKQGKPELRGARQLPDGNLLITAPSATIAGFRMAPRAEGAAELVLEAGQSLAVPGDVIVTQRSAKGVDGGVTLRVAKRP